MSGDVLVRWRLESSTRIHGQARIYSIKQGLSRVEHDCKTIFVRLLYGSKYGLLRPSTIKHDFYSINWTFTGFTYGPTDFVRVMLELSHIRVCFDIKLTRFDGLAPQIFELSTEKV